MLKTTLQNGKKSPGWTKVDYLHISEARLSERKWQSIKSYLVDLIVSENSHFG
jgi:hypothetical protein